MSQGPTKRNIVQGVDHMGSIYKAMPAISEFIEAEYKEEELDEAYKNAMNLPDPETPLPDDLDGYDVYWTNWTLKGKQLSFTICFEKYEMLYEWAIRCPDEESYLRTKAFINSHLRIG